MLLPPKLLFPNNPEDVVLVFVFEFVFPNKFEDPVFEAPNVFVLEEPKVFELLPPNKPPPVLLVLFVFPNSPPPVFVFDCPNENPELLLDPPPNMLPVLLEALFPNNEVDWEVFVFPKSDPPEAPKLDVPEPNPLDPNPDF